MRAGEPFLGRIVRHELSHLAIGSRDDGAPVWLSEGIAEYLGAREIPLRDRIIPTSALTRAQTEDAGMPVSKTFNNTDQEWHYALSWMACDYIAETSGESRLVGARRRHAQQRRRHRATRRRTACSCRCSATTASELARRAAARIGNLYR